MAYKKYKTLSVVFYLLSLIPIFSGCYKLAFYDPDELVNAYVGADAYNLIINGTSAAALFVLALIFVVLGSAFLICYNISKNSSKSETISSDELPQL